MNDLDALWAFLVAAAAALVLTPVAARLAHRVGAIDLPRERGLHDKPTPSLGGLAILAGVLAAEVFFLPWSTETRGILAGAAAIALIGAVDDAKEGGLSPAVKLAGQLAAAAIPVFADVRVENITLPFLDPLDLGDWGIPLTLLGLVAVMNVVNFTDGVDGLAAGVCTIAAITFAVIALSLDRVEAGILAAAVGGACVGFLRHNFHPASIFMGDSGSNLLGLLLGVRGHPGGAEDGRGRGPVLPAGDPRRARPGRHLRGGQAAQVPPPRLLRRPLALPSPVREHRLLRHPHGALPVRLDRVAGRAGAGAAVRALLR